MEPELQKFASVALIGLLAFFPVFNQVKDTSLEALTDADHKAKWGDFFKDWSDIPDDEKLEYWDGRNKPPGGDGDFDRDRLDDDFKAGNGDGDDGDRDGDGVPDEDDADPEDPEVGEKPRYRWVEEVLFTKDFSGQSTAESPGYQDIRSDTTSYKYVNVSWEYRSFTGNAEFSLEVDGSRACCDRTVGSDQFPAVSESDTYAQSVADVGKDRLRFNYDYRPTVAPTSFVVTVTAAYQVVVGNSTEDSS